MVLQFTNSEPNSSVFYTEQLNRLRILGTKLLPLGKGLNRHGTGDLEWTLRSGVGTGSVTVKSRRFMYIVCADMCIDTVWIDCIGLWIVSIYIYMDLHPHAHMCMCTCILQWRGRYRLCVCVCDCVLYPPSSVHCECLEATGTASTRSRWHKMIPEHPCAEGEHSENGGVVVVTCQKGDAH